MNEHDVYPGWKSKDRVCMPTCADQVENQESVSWIVSGTIPKVILKSYLEVRNPAFSQVYSRFAIYSTFTPVMLIVKIQNYPRAVHSADTEHIFHSKMGRSRQHTWIVCGGMWGSHTHTYIRIYIHIYIHTFFLYYIPIFNRMGPMPFWEMIRCTSCLHQTTGVNSAVAIRGAMVSMLYGELRSPTKAKTNHQVQYEKVLYIDIGIDVYVHYMEVCRPPKWTWFRFKFQNSNCPLVVKGLIESCWQKGTIKEKKMLSKRAPTWSHMQNWLMLPREWLNVNHSEI